VSVHKKLQQARVALSQRPLRKSGHNKHHGWDYFELADFLPEVQRIFSETGLCGRTWFDGSMANLTIYDASNPESYVTFCSPVAEAKLSKGTPIQELGAMHTYMRRYLWVMAMEICENDAVDAQDQGTVKRDAPPSMAGKPGPWQLKIATEVTGGIDNWIAELNKLLDLALGMATSVDDVTEIFRVNRPIFETLKGEDDAAYTAALTKFKDAKQKLGS
jgi:hypothetical protein